MKRNQTIFEKKLSKDLQAMTDLYEREHRARLELETQYNDLKTNFILLAKHKLQFARRKRKVINTPSTI